MKDAGFPIVHLPDATPRQQGRVHGESLREEIRRNIELYLQRFRTEAALTSDDIERRTDHYLGVFARTSPRYMESMEGIAEASGSSLRNITLLNARYEVIYSTYSESGLAAGGCTAFAAPRSATGGGHLLMGQTWDWIPGVAVAIMKVKRGNLQIAAFTEAGIVGEKIGMNSRGLGLLINGLVSNLDNWSNPGTPFHVRTWRILRSQNLSEATRHAVSGKHSCSASFTIAKGSGQVDKIINLETSPNGVCEFRVPDGAVLIHTNHFIEPDQLSIRQPLGEERDSTYRRFERLGHLFGDPLADRRLTMGDLEAVLRDHDGFPDSVCRHPNMGLPIDERCETRFAVIMDLDDFTLRYVPGTPCLGEFHFLT